MLVRDAMTREVVTVGPSATLKEVAELLTERRISGLLVTDGAGKVLGVVSEADVVARELPPEHRPSRSAQWRYERPADFERLLRARTAGEAMTAPAVAVEPDRSVTEAVSLMFDHAVNRLPVVRRGKLVGIITRADIVRAFARTDLEIRQEIRDDLLVETFQLDPDALEVTVERGEVTLAGELQRARDVQLLRRLVERVPGVVSVRVTAALSALGM